MHPQFDSLDKVKQELMLKHLDCVIEANKSVNLTRIDDREEAVLLHIEDSLTALPELGEAPEGLYGDLGSGAGYPGIPLAIASGRQTLLVDARKKKMDTVAAIVEKLGLQDQIATFGGRAELLARRRGGEFSVLTARALSRLVVLVELASPLLARGGRLICYKSHVDQDELDEAIYAERLVGMKLVRDRAFMMDEYMRRIIVFEKAGKPRIKLPRQEGMAQREPLQG